MPSPFKIQDRAGGRSKNLEGPTEIESLLKEKFLRLMHNDIESVPRNKDSVLQKTQNEFKVTNETSIKPSENSKKSKIKEENSNSRSFSEEKLVPNLTDKLFISKESNDKTLMGVTEEKIEPSSFKLQDQVLQNKDQMVYSCKDCPRQFDEKANLQTHVQIHTGWYDLTFNAQCRTF